MSCAKYRNRKTIFVGEVNSGKTLKTLQVLRDLLQCGAEPLAVLDLAPDKTQGVGGKLPLSPEEKERISYLAPRILAPRLLGKSAREIEKLAQENGRATEEFLEILDQKVWQSLIINDVSLYLQTRDARRLMDRIGAIPTLVINGYHGVHFGTSAFSQKEREQMEVLISLCDQVIYFPTRTPPA